MQRREFLGIAAAGAAGAIFPARARAFASADPTGAAEPRLLGILRDETLVRELGRQFRRLVPAEDNALALRHALDSAPLAVADDASATGLDACVRDDFAAGRTLTLQGWVVSVTEARQCALFSLQPT